MIELPRPIRGIIPPVLTPLLDQDTLDATAFERLIDQAIDGGSAAIFVLGSTGELAGLSGNVRRQVISRAATAVARRVPLLVGITDPVVSETLELAEYAAKARADAVVIAAPFYFRLSQRDYLAYLQRLIPKLPLPVYLYNIPSLTKFSIHPDTVRTLAGNPSILGLKDSSGDIGYFLRVVECLRDRPDFALLVGIEETLCELLDKGAHGGVCGGANLSARLFVDLYHAVLRQDTETAAQLQRRVIALSEGVYHHGEPESSYLRGIKTAASVLGFGNGLIAEPYSAMSPTERSLIAQGLGQAGLI